MNAKFFTEGIFLIILTIIFQYYLLQATTAAQSVDTLYSTYAGLTDATSQEAAFTTFTTKSQSFYTNMQVTIYLSFFAVTFPLKIVLEMIFAYKSKRIFHFMTTTNLLDIAISIVFFIRIVYEFSYYRSGIVYSATDGYNGVIYYNNIYLYRSDGNFLAYLYSIGSACLWFRILLLFRLTRFLGPIVKMIQNMMYDILIFMILFGIELVIFASIGTLLFSSISSYSDFYTTIKTLFEIAMGSWDFSTLSSNNKSEYLGDIFTFVVVVINNILLLNLLIAILASTYGLLESKKDVMYIIEILKLRSSLEYDKNCSSLVSTFPPLNFIISLFSPFFLALKNSKPLNKFLFHLEYIPLLLLSSVFYIVMNLLLIPFAYVKGIFVNLYFIFYEEQETTLLYRVFRFISFGFFGIPILLLNFCADLIVFYIHCYQANLSYRKVQKKTLSISQHHYFTLQQKFEEEHKAGTSTIDFKNMSIYMRDKMNVMNNIYDLIFNYEKEMQGSIPQSMNEVNQYVLVKEILQACSLPKGKATIIYIQIMKSIMADLKMGARISFLISNRKDTNSSKRKISQSGDTYLHKLFYVNLFLLYKSFDSNEDSKVDLQNIKEIVELALFENSYLFSNQLNRKLSIVQNQESEHVSNQKKLSKYKQSMKNILEDAEELIK